METLQRSLEIARSRPACQDAGFLSRQRYRLEKARDMLLWELGNASVDEEARPGRRDDQRSCARTREVMTWLESRLGRRLRAVERALEKIEEGTYGICDVTGEAITPRRLEAMPEAVYTLEAQRRLRARP